MNKQNSFSNKTIEALKMAIEFIERHVEADEYDWLIQACKEALAEAERHEWQSLSDDEIENILDNSVYCEVDAKPFARAIEAKLKEKNHE